MADVTDRLALPLLAAGQAQKEVFHNEALLLLDLVAGAGVEAVGPNTPPASPTPGQAWVVGPAPTDDWAGHGQALAGRTAGGWRFVAPREGLAVWSAADGAVARFHSGAWEVGNLRGHAVLIDGNKVVGARAAAIADPSGGATVDSEARAAIGAVLAALRGHGLIAS